MIVVNFEVAKPLEAQMGKFGGNHKDRHDACNSLSCAQSLNEIPDDEGWEPGRFHLLGLGFYTTLERLLV